MLFFTMLVPYQSGFSKSNYICPAPEATISDRASNSISFSWDVITGATVYKVWYSRAEDRYISSEITTSGNSISFSTLTPGTYTFYFVTVCTGGTSTNYVIEGILMD